VLYYASGHNVYCLNAATRTQAHIATLTFEARCTASGHGYVCVGGAEQGNFAAIRVTGFPPADAAQVDASLPLDLSTRTTVPRPPLLGLARDPEYEQIGEDIVNSISIHKLPTGGSTQDDVVAVLTNNDKTVRIYSLVQRLELICLDLPFPMNHATISPDGQLLVAVGDEHSGFFFRRKKLEKANFAKQSDNRRLADTPEWTLFQEVGLYVPKGSCIKGYFTTAWSPSGRLCAVGSECGYITVFDVELLKRCEYGEDAIIQVLSSTRPDITTGPGAVRTMQFSPAPWDFLVWSEDQARVCVADIRSDLKVKQTLSLDPKEEALEKIHIADFDLQLNPEVSDVRREADFIRRYRRALDSEGTAAAVNFATDYIEASSERSRLHRSLGVVESHDDPHGLTAHERQVLEALRTTRQRDGTRETSITPRSINYNTSASMQARRYDASVNVFPLGLRTNHVTREREAATRRNNMAETFTEFMSESARQLNQIQERTTPRRQASVIGSLDVDANTRATHTNITGGAMTRSPNPVPTVTRRDNSEFIASTDDAWRTMEEALTRNARAADSARSSTGPELRNELRRLRQLTQMRERLRNAREAQGPLENYGLGMNFRRASRSYHDSTIGVRTAGLAMSPDGRTLYCGTEEGIFEFKLNLHQRKGCPAIRPR
jgi:WD40 repeat protein